MIILYHKLILNSTYNERNIFKCITKMISIHNINNTFQSIRKIRTTHVVEKLGEKNLNNNEQT